jgi:hypothetical protein
MVQGVCSTCGRPICDTCLVELNGQVFCKACLETKVARPSREVNGFVRFVLSVMPGLGHLYMGLIQRGLQLLVGAVLGAIVLGNLYAPFLGFFIPGMIFFSIFDAREAHLRMAQGLEVEDKALIDPKTLKIQWDNKFIGYGLIGIGALVMFNSIVGDLMRVIIPPQYYYAFAQAIRGVVTGALAIAAGFWLLTRRPSGNPGNQSNPDNTGNPGSWGNP